MSLSLPSIPGRARPIGVEVDGDVLRVAQGLPGGAVESFELARVAGEAAEDGWPGAAECRRLAAVIARRRFRGRNVVLSVPQAACRLVEAEVPAGASVDDPVTAAVHLAGEAASFDVAEHVLAVTPVRGGVSVQRFLVRGCKRGPLEAACAAMADAGLAVAAVRTRADALAAASGVEATAWLDITVDSPAEDRDRGVVRAMLLIVEAGQPAYGRPVRTPLPGRLAAASPASCESLAAELLPGLRHAERRMAADAVERLRIGDASGTATPAAAAHAEAFATHLAARLELSSEPPSAAVAAALSCSAPGTPNLLPPTQRTLRRERTACRAVLAAAAGYAALAAVLLALLTSAKPAPVDAADATDLLDRADRATARAGVAGVLAERGEAEVAALARAATAAEAAADRPDWRRLLGRLAADAGDGVRFTEVEVRPEAGGVAIRVSGEAPDPRAAWDFALALERGDLFERVELARTRRADTRPDAPVLFQVNLGLLPLKPEASRPEGFSDAGVSATVTTP